MAFTERLFLSLRLGPQAVRRLVGQIEPFRYDVAVVEGRFTLREEVAHLADCESLFLARIVQTVERPGTTVAGFDETVRAAAQGYGSWEVKASLDMFERERERTVGYLENMSQEDFDKVGPHETRGPMSALEYAWGIVGHDVYHIEHLTRYASIRLTGG